MWEVFDRIGLLCIGAVPEEDVSCDNIRCRGKFDESPSHSLLKLQLGILNSFTISYLLVFS